MVMLTNTLAVKRKYLKKENKLVKKKATKKEVETVISNMINHLKFLDEKLGALDSLFGLYLEWKKDKDTFNKFVEDRVKEYNNKENEPGETK